jgi:hypothetical protein
VNQVAQTDVTPDQPQDAAPIRMMFEHAEEGAELAVEKG